MSKISQDALGIEVVNGEINNINPFNLESPPPPLMSRIYNESHSWDCKGQVSYKL